MDINNGENIEIKGLTGVPYHIIENKNGESQIKYINFDCIYYGEKIYYDKNTKLSSIGNLKFNVSSFIVYAKKIDFIIKGSHTFTINEVEIDIPVTGAVLSIEDNEWVIKDYASMDYLGILHSNNLIVRIIGKDYVSAASSIHLKPEWADVETIRAGPGWKKQIIHIQLVKSQLELNEVINELLERFRTGME